MKAKYPGRAGPEFYRDAEGCHRWRVWSRNGRILADSGEGYRHKADCRRGLRATARQIAGAQV